jgi:alkanesulfonate monooxygenase SsuD/methylene tetrahydromethanopterin reductase-like flavin-dependent oxidoreductase (luciferase family)
VEIDVGLDTHQLPYEEQRQLHQSAARLGFGKIWTTAGQDPFLVCALRWRDSLDAVPGGIGTGIGVATVQSRTPEAFATSAAMLTRLTGGRFILGIGAGSIYSAAHRREWGIRDRPLAKVRTYAETLRAFLAGEAVTFKSDDLTYEGARLGVPPAPTPVYLGALGPEMLRLAGEVADGVVLSWMTAPRLEWARERIAEGAARAGCDPASIRVATNVRVSVDDDVGAARRALAAAMYSYVVPSAGAIHATVYRPHMERAGFDRGFQELDRLVEKGLGREQVLEEFPEELLQGFGYYGPAAGAAEALRRHAGSADTAIVRVVPSGGGAAGARAVMEACAPAVVSGES